MAMETLVPARSDVPTFASRVRVSPVTTCLTFGWLDEGCAVIFTSSHMEQLQPEVGQRKTTQQVMVGVKPSSIVTATYLDYWLFIVSAEFHQEEALTSVTDPKEKSCHENVEPEFSSLMIHQFGLREWFLVRPRGGSRGRVSVHGADLSHVTLMTHEEGCSSTLTICLLLYDSTQFRVFNFIFL